MARVFRNFPLVLLAAAGLGLVTACNIAGTGSGGTGRLTLLMTDAPTDDWTEVTVHFLSASLHRQGGTWVDFWEAVPGDPASGKVNLIDLGGVTDIFNAAEIQAGAYDRLKLVLNTSTAPDSMNLVTADGAVILPEDITVIDPTGKGEIVVELDPRLLVEAGENNLVGVDFDLAHPLSIVNLGGKVVINLRVRHMTLPRNLNRLQFARTLGDITEAAANADGTATFSVKNLQGATITFNADGLTIYTDISSGAGAAGTFEGLLALAGSGAALVASNMNADGSLYARRVWYADSIDKLPQFTPEGLVRRVGDYWLSIQGKNAEALSTRHFHRCRWDAETVFVNADTAWSFQGDDMGLEGVAGLRHIARGFRVEVVAVDENVTPKIARSVNIQYAHAEGIVTEPTLEGFTLGWSWRARVMAYSAVSGREFGWWFYGMDPARSPDRQALIDTAAAAREARLWIFAWAGLAWDAAGARWVVENLVLAPMKLHELTRITGGYGTVEGNPEAIVVSTFNGWDRTTPERLTVELDHDAEDAIQTIVGSFIWRADTNVVTFTLPVPPDQWDELLTPAVDKVRIWVHPVAEDGGTFAWHATSVLVYQFIR